MSKWHGGKGSSPRPYSVGQEQFANNWDAIFKKNKTEDNTGTDKNEYQDVLSTEDCMTEIDDKVTRYNQETQEVKSRV